MQELDRVIIPEILDSLDASDPRAIRSRQDLRRIDFYLGNSRWILRQLHNLPSTQIVEIGAGEGDLCRKIRSSIHFSTTITGLDLIDRPLNLPVDIQWIAGDFFQTLNSIEADTCVGSLILHHFSESALRDLGVRLQSFRQLIFCEPLRSRLPLALSKLASGFISEVTRHDMPASIRAGFRPGEIPALLGLDPSKWLIRESSDWRGALRLASYRR